MTTQSSMSKSVNACSRTLSVVQCPLTQVHLYLKKQPDALLQFENTIPADLAKLTKCFQRIRQSEQYGGGYDGKEMSTIQTSAPPQNPGCGDQDGHPLSYLPVHSRIRSSSRPVREILAELRRAWSQGPIYENGEAGQGKMLHQISLSGSRKQVIPAASGGNRVRTQRSHQKTDFEKGPDRLTAGQRKILRSLLLTRSRKRVAHGENQVPSKRSRREVQKTDCDDHRQESVRFPLPDLQNPLGRSSPEADLEIETVSCLALPQRQICENGENRVEVGQRKILRPLSRLGRIPDENRGRAEKNQHSVQKDHRRYYLSVPTVREVISNGRLIRQPCMNVMIRTPPTTQENFQKPSKSVSSAKSRRTGTLSSKHPPNQRNNVDIIQRGNLEQFESYCRTSAADGSLDNKDSRLPGFRLMYINSSKMQQYMERYLDRWVLEPTFLEEVSSIACVLGQKGLFDTRASPQSEPQSSSASLLLQECNPRCWPISP